MIWLKRSIEYLLYLFIFLLPWQTRLIWHEAFINGSVWEYGRFSLYGTQLILWLALLLYFVLLFRVDRFKRIAFKNVSRFLHPAAVLYWLSVLLICIAGVSIVWAIDKELAYYRWFILLQAGALLSLVVNIGPKFKTVAIVWVSSSIVQGLFASWQFFTQYVFANKWLGLATHFPNLPGAIILQTSTERWLRAYGSLPHPNVLAGFLLVGFFFLVYLALFTKTRFGRWLVVAGLLAILPGLFFTFSRSAWVALISYLLGFGWWLYLRKKQKYTTAFFKIFLLSTLIIAVLALNLSGPVFTRLVGQEELEVNSIQLRFAFTDQALQIINANPWQGTGIGNYTLGVAHYVNATWPGYYYQPVHNIYLLVFAELGAFGFAVFMLLIGLFLWQALRGAVTVKAMTLWLSFVAILIISLFDHYFWTLESGVVFFWLILALNIRQLKKLDGS